jgi:hypothetical protein
MKHQYTIHLRDLEPEGVLRQGVLLENSPPIHCFLKLRGLASGISEFAMTTLDNISLMRRWYREVWQEGKNDTIYELIAPDAVLIGQTGPQAIIHGPKEFAAFADKIRNAFPDTDIKVEDAFGIGDRVAVRWSATMTHKGTSLGASYKQKGRDHRYVNRSYRRWKDRRRVGQLGSASDAGTNRSVQSARGGNLGEERLMPFLGQSFPHSAMIFSCAGVIDFRGKKNNQRATHFS